MTPTRYRSLGASPSPEGVRYRVWAPDHQKVSVSVDGDGGPSRFVNLQRDNQGFFEGLDPMGVIGDLYRYYLDEHTYSPDPASRFQPQGVFGPSQVVASGNFDWHTPEWCRPAFRGRVIYEIHVGTFTPEGTFSAAIAHLPYLSGLGVNTIELMPLAEFPGRWNWGYDGVFPFAPAHCYGSPDELRALVNAAHGRGIAVMLDVVYNHLGPTCNPLPAFTSLYAHPERKTPWGTSLNYDGPHSSPLREFFLQNVAAWLDDYRFDGLRLDSIHSIMDDSPVHFLNEVVSIAQSRSAWLVGEDNRNLAQIIMPTAAHGLGLDAVWADDFHHSVRVALTGQHESHFGSYTGTAAELAESIAHGWYYRGQHYRQWERPRGTSASTCPPESFVWCISNHDQVGNRPRGDRLNAVASPAAYRAASLLLCVGPGTPLLFMGQEWGASTPFYFFSDHPGEIGSKMAQGRINELSSYGINLDEETKAAMPDPQNPETFHASKLVWNERDALACEALLALYRDALGLRAHNIIFQSPPRTQWKAWPASDTVVALRWFDPAGDWLLLVSLDRTSVDEIRLEHVSGLEAPAGQRWVVRLDSNASLYGGTENALASYDKTGFRLVPPASALFHAA